MNIPLQNIPIEYPIEIIMAANATPLGKFLSAFSVWSTSPPTASIPPYANIAYVRKENIEGRV